MFGWGSTSAFFYFFQNKTHNFLNQNIYYLIQNLIPLVNSNNSNPDEAYYIDKKASEIKDVEEVKKYLKNNTQLF